MTWFRILFLAVLLWLLGLGFSSEITAKARSTGETTLVVGSKRFTESYILAEIMAQLLEAEGFRVERRLGLGGTMIAFEALRSGSIDLYPEYTGTLSLNILRAEKDLPLRQLNRRLVSYQMELLDPIGFNNTYAIALPRPLAEEHKIKTIEDLAGFDWVAAFGHEFVERQDGWPGLRDLYGLSLRLRPTEQALAYQALSSGAAQVMDAYSTDASLDQFDLRILKDNKNYFPKYLAAPLVRQDIPTRAKRALGQLADRIDDEQMRALNRMAAVDGLNFTQVASFFLQESGLLARDQDQALLLRPSVDYAELGRLTLQHLYLTFFPVFLACLLAIPLGILLTRKPSLAPTVITLTGLLQTIPSLALLVLMIWYYDQIGLLPAMTALFLYSLLPILRNTYAGIKNVDPQLIESARGIGLYPREILWHVELPLAMPIIVSGIRTATVINVGMATIAAFIGAGGLGVPIVTGLALNDTRIILQGAIPAAALAIVLEFCLERVERWLSLKR